MDINGKTTLSRFEFKNENGKYYTYMLSIVSKNEKGDYNSMLFRCFFDPKLVKNIITNEKNWTYKKGWKCDRMKVEVKNGFLTTKDGKYLNFYIKDMDVLDYDAK